MGSGVESLDGFPLLFGLDLLEFNLALGSALETSDLFLEFLVLVEVGAEGGSQVGELSLVLLADFSQSNHGGVLLVDEFAEGSLSLDEAVGDVHLLAEVGEPEDNVDGVDVVGNGDQLGLLVFNEFGDVVESELEVIGLGFVHFLLCIRTDILSALNLASSTNRALRCLASSGEYFFRSLKRTPAE